MPDPEVVRLIQAEGKTRTFEIEDGSIIERSGGSVSWRNNNPGNLKFEFEGSADPTVHSQRTRKRALADARDGYAGVVDLDQWGNAIFESYEAGRAAKIVLLSSRYPDKTIEGFLPSYSRADYSGATNHRAQAAAIFAECDRQGFDLRGKTVGQMTQSEREALADGIRLFEGWREGTVNTVRPAPRDESLPQTSGKDGPLPEINDPPGVTDDRGRDNRLLEQLRERVRGIDQQAGKDWDDNSERLAASALVMATRMGFTEKDELLLAFNQPTEHVRAGEILHLYRQGPNASPDPAANRIHMSTSEALSMPAEQRYQQAETISQTPATHQQGELMHGRDDPNRSGPRLAM